MFRSFVSALAGRRSLVAGVVMVGVLLTTPIGAQQAPAAAQAGPTTLKFGPDAGMVLHFIKKDKVADFELVMAKCKEALQKSSKPERKAQATGWKLFKSQDPAGENVLYVFFIDPALKDADYSVANILAEGFPPTDVNALYEKYRDAYAPGQNILNLGLISDFGK
jgi:hypothetical protein